VAPPGPPPDVRRRPEHATAGAVSSPVPRSGGSRASQLCHLCRRTGPGPGGLGDRPQQRARVRARALLRLRCPRCRCIHAFGDVDLDRYYRHYGLHEAGLDLLERILYRNKLRFIRGFVPLDRGSPVLDFGCGNGIFVEYLRRRGYTDVAGYDPYSASHADPGVLGRRAPGTRRRTGRAGRLPLPPDPRRPPYRPGAGGHGPPGAPAALPPAPGHDGLARVRAPPARLRTRGQDSPPLFPYPDPVPQPADDRLVPGPARRAGRPQRAVPLVVAPAAGLLLPGARRRARLPDGPTRSSSSSGVPAEAGAAGTAERRRTAGWTAVRYRQERCT
jgi:hypothetical protein